MTSRHASRSSRKPAFFGSAPTAASLICAGLFIFSAGNALADEYYLGQWQVCQEEEIKYWCAPEAEYSTGAIDLRSLPEQAQRPEDASGLGLFSYSQPVEDETLIYLSGAFDETLGLPVKERLQDELGVVLKAGTLREAVWELLTQKGDPTGQSRWKPLMPGKDLKRRIYFGREGKVKEQAFRMFESEGWELVMATYHENYRRQLGSESREIVAKHLDWLEDKYRIHYTNFIPKDAIVIASLPHATVITEDFDTADTDTLGADLTWTELSFFGTASDIDIVSNAAKPQKSWGTDFARADSDLSGTDQYATIEVVSSQSSDQKPGVMLRKDSSSTNTFYIFRTKLSSSLNGDEAEVLKMVNGTTTLIAAVSLLDLGSSPEIKGVADGSDLATYANDTLYATATDTAIMSGFRTGIYSFQTSLVTELDNFEAGDWLSSNVAPTVNAGSNTQALVSTPWSIDGTVSDDGLPNPPAAVTVTWSKQSGPGTVTFGNANAVDTTATFSAVGTYVLGLTADDGEIAAYDNVTITVLDNFVPVVDAGGHPVLDSVNETLNIDATVTDDGNPNPPGTVTATWSKQSGPGTVTFGNINAVDTTATFSQAGTYVLRLTAYDGTATVYNESVVGVKESPYISTSTFDLTGFTESDPSGAVTVTSTCVDYYRLEARSTNTYLYKPYPVHGDFIFEFDTEHTIASPMVDTVVGHFLIWGVSNDSATTVDDWTASGAYLAAYIFDSELKFYFYGSTIGNTSSAYYNFDQRYYWRIEKSGDTLTAKIYSDSARTTLLETLTRTLTPASFQYVYAISAKNDFYGDRKITGDGCNFVHKTPHTAPEVAAGADQETSFGSGINLDATVTDDGMPNPPGAIDTAWTKESGPGTVTFGDADAVDTTAGFSAPGTYVLRLTADDGDLTSYDELSVFVGLPATTLSAAAGDRAVTVSWPAVTGATGYKVKYGTSTGTYTTTVDAGNVLSKQIINLTNATTYYFAVVAYDANGDGNLSNEDDATPQLSTPTYGSDQATGGTSNASSCLQGCGGQYSHTMAFNDTINTNDTWVADNTQTGWLEYEFASSKTIEKYVIHPRAALAGNPTAWTFEAYNGTSWDVLDTRSNISWPNLTAQSFTFSNSTAYTKYRLNISANGGHVEVGITEMEMMEMTGASSPSAISDLQGTVGNASAVLSWSAPANNGEAITGYQVEYGTVASGAFASLQMDDATPGVTVTGLTNYVPYQFRVVAINAKGMSGVSNTVNVTPFAGTAVSGAIAADTTWTLAGSPYVVGGDITVNTGVTLTIQADVEVLFNGNYEFVLNGYLNSLGTETGPIVFSSTSTAPAKGDWKHIKVNNHANRLQFLTVQYSDKGIYVPSGISSPKDPIIRNNTLQNNNNGIYFEPSTAPMITGNTITGNTNGINAFCNIFTACDPTIMFNSITSNSGYNMFVQGDNASLVITAENNWWGSATQSTVEAGIFDHADDATEATVDFMPYLSAAPTEDGVFLSAISASDVFVNMRSETVNINYSIDKNSNVTIKIYDYLTGALVRTLLNNQARTAGSTYETWDVENDSSALVPAGAYVFMIEAVAADGSRDFYGPFGLAGNDPDISNASITPSTTFSPDKGDRVAFEFDLDEPGLVSVGFEGDEFISNRPLNAGTNVLHWGGWGASGLMSFYQNTVSIDAVATPIPDNAILVSDGRTIDISVGKADPYIIRPLYNQITTVSYTITEAADVTVKVLTPDGATLLRTLESNVAKSAGSYQIVWDGRDTNGATIAEDGNYRVRIEAEDSFGSVATRDVSVRVLY